MAGASGQGWEDRGRRRRRQPGGMCSVAAAVLADLRVRGVWRSSAGCGARAVQSADDGEVEDRDGERRGRAAWIYLVENSTAPMAILHRTRLCLLPVFFFSGSSRGSGRQRGANCLWEARSGAGANSAKIGPLCRTGGSWTETAALQSGATRERKIRSRGRAGRGRHLRSSGFLLIQQRQVQASGVCREPSAGGMACQARII